MKKMSFVLAVVVLIAAGCGKSNNNGGTDNPVKPPVKNPKPAIDSIDFKGAFHALPEQKNPQMNTDLVGDKLRITLAGSVDVTPSKGLDAAIDLSKAGSWTITAPKVGGCQFDKSSYITLSEGNSHLEFKLVGFDPKIGVGDCWKFADPVYTGQDLVIQFSDTPVGPDQKITETMFTLSKGN